MQRISPEPWDEVHNNCHTVRGVLAFGVTPNTCRSERCALVIGHAGHEIRIHEWVKRHKPTFFVLTDGSGSAGEARLSSTTRVVEKLGCRIGSIYGWGSDQELYARMLAQDHDVFRAILHKLTATLVEGEYEVVCGEAEELFSPTHDICRYLVCAAVERVRFQTGRELQNFDFLINGRPDDLSESSPENTTVIKLSDEEMDSKSNAAYQYEELRGEVDEFLKVFGREAFRYEILRRSPPLADFDRDLAEKPLYERFGEDRVTRGIYQDVIRWETHVRPILQCLIAEVKG